jgi:MFS family permease
VALSNTTLGPVHGVLGRIDRHHLDAGDLPGIHLDPLAASNIVYLLWMVLGYLLVTAVLVVPLGRLGGIFGRMRTYKVGFLIFSVASLALSIDPRTGHSGALWLILWRLVQAVGGSMLLPTRRPS